MYLCSWAQTVSTTPTTALAAGSCAAISHPSRTALVAWGWPECDSCMALGVHVLASGGEEGLLHAVGSVFSVCVLSFSAQLNMCSQHTESFEDTWPRHCHSCMMRAPAPATRDPTDFLSASLIYAASRPRTPTILPMLPSEARTSQKRSAYSYARPSCPSPRGGCAVVAKRHSIVPLTTLTDI